MIVLALMRYAKHNAITFTLLISSLPLSSILFLEDLHDDDEEENAANAGAA